MLEKACSSRGWIKAVTVLSTLYLYLMCTYIYIYIYIHSSGPIRIALLMSLCIVMLVMCVCSVQSADRQFAQPHCTICRFSSLLKYMLQLREFLFFVHPISMLTCFSSLYKYSQMSLIRTPLIRARRISDSGEY